MLKFVGFLDAAPIVFKMRPLMMMILDANIPHAAALVCH